MMKNKSQLMLTMLFIAFGDAASAIAQSVRDEQALPAAGVEQSGSRSRENLGNGHGAIVETKLPGTPIGHQTRPFVHEYFERGISNAISFDYRRLGFGAGHTIAGVGAVQVELQQEFFWKFL